MNTSSLRESRQKISSTEQNSKNAKSKKNQIQCKEEVRFKREPARQKKHAFKSHIPTKKVPKRKLQLNKNLV